MEPKRPLFPIYDIMEHWAAFAFTTPEVRPVHHALYHALVHMCKRRGGAHRFNLHYQEGMQACGIAARNTYVAALRELEGWGFVVYTPGANALRSAIVDVKFCACAEQALSTYRASVYTSGDASTEHIIKEVKGLREDAEKAAATIEELKAEIEDLKSKATANGGEPHSLPAKKTKRELAEVQAVASGDETFTADTFGALNDPQIFADLLTYLGYANLDTERYRLDIRGKAKGDGMVALPGSFNRYITSYMKREMEAGPLLPPPKAARPAIAPMPNNPAELWGALNPHYDHRRPNGQYTGTVQ